MCTYTYARYAATRGLKRRKLSTPCDPHRVLCPPVTCFSSYSIFTHCTGSLSLSFYPMSAIRFIFSLPPSASLSVSELSFSYHSLISLLSLTLSFLSVFLSSSFIRDYASRIACRNTPICCCYYVVAADETLRCTRICARKKTTPVCRT